MKADTIARLKIMLEISSGIDRADLCEHMTENLETAELALSVIESHVSADRDAELTEHARARGLHAN